jgi:hypothetical protein
MVVKTSDAVLIPEMFQPRVAAVVEGLSGGEEI